MSRIATLPAQPTSGAAAPRQTNHDKACNPLQGNNACQSDTAMVISMFHPSAANDLPFTGTAKGSGAVR